jgi:hypothetical protein
MAFVIKKCAYAADPEVREQRESWKQLNMIRYKIILR